jgi:periplasmic mercuric ion binding protein
MKKLHFLLVLLLGVASVSVAQQKRIMTAKINTPGAQCENCKKRIENYLKRYDGVAKINVDVRQKKTTVTYSTDRISLDEIKVAIANAGYDADDITANEDSYKALPQLCKKPADGGHPDPRKKKN